MALHPIQMQQTYFMNTEVRVGIEVIVGAGLVGAHDGVLGGVAHECVVLEVGAFSDSLLQSLVLVFVIVLELDLPRSLDIEVGVCDHSIVVVVPEIHCWLLCEGLGFSGQ